MLAVAAAAGVAGIALGCATAHGARGKGGAIGHVEEGKASYYGRGLRGRARPRRASGSTRTR